MARPARSREPAVVYSTPPALAYNIPQFCEAARISLRLYFKMRDQGLGPKETRIGRRVVITIESALAWIRAREAATARRQAMLSAGKEV